MNKVGYYSNNRNLISGMVKNEHKQFKLIDSRDSVERVVDNDAWQMASDRVSEEFRVKNRQPLHELPTAPKEDPVISIG